MPAANITGGMIAYGVYLEPVRVPVTEAQAGRLELWQVNRRGKACLSYVLVSGGEAVVVDPSRHVEWYEGFVAERKARVVRVLDTHVHADHVSGGPALARRLGVPYFVADGPGFELRQNVTPLTDREVIHLGGEEGVSIEVRVMNTPGHTPGSTSYLVDGAYLLTGDTLFVASVGRPDLGGHVVEWGRALFETLSRRLADLPDRTVVLPAHYGGMSEDSREGVVWGHLGRPPPDGARAGDRDRGGVRRGRAGRGQGPAEGLRRDHPGEPGRPRESREDRRRWELGKNQCAVSARDSAGT